MAIPLFYRDDKQTNSYANTIVLILIEEIYSKNRTLVYWAVSYTVQFTSAIKQFTKALTKADNFQPVLDEVFDVGS